MLQLYDLNKNKIQGLTKYKDLKIESTLSSGDKVLSFSYPKNLSESIAEEGYIRTKTDEYVIKQLGKSYDDYITVSCNLNLEELEGKVWESFSSVEQTVDSAIKLAIAGTGWTVKNNGVNKKRTIRKTGCSALAIIQQCIKTYRCEIKYDSINKIINVYKSIGSDKGCYFTDQLNLKELSIQSDSYNFYTIIEAYGKNDIHCTVENYQYSHKKKALYWKDERYTDIDSLREDATLKLAEISIPARAYKASIYDLARLSNKYKNILDYALGDTITLINKDTDTRIKQRIVKTVEYPDNPENNTVEISNTFASFEEIQKEQQETEETVSNITEDNGTISLKAMQNGWIELNKVNVQDLNAIRANIGTLNANEVIADELHAHKASINDLATNKANITDLTASNIQFKTAEGGTLTLETLLSRFISGEQGQFLNLTGDNVVINEAVIKNIIAKNMSLDDLKSCKVTTSLMQFIDKDGNVRVQIGKDTTGNFTFILKGRDGKATLIDGNGIHEKAIADNLIVNRMIGENAVGSKQLDYESINNDGNTFKSSKIKFDTTGQTLDVAFNTLKSNVDNTQEQITANTTKIGVNQGKIDTLIKDTTITKDGKDITLKDAYSSLQQSVNGFETKVSNAKTEAIKTASTDATNKANQALADAKGYTNNSVNTVIERVTTAESSIEQLSDSITSKVSMTEVNNAINGIEIGGRNLLYHSDFSNITTLPYSYNGRNWRTASASDDSDLSRKVVDITTCPFIKKIKGVKIVSNKTTDNDMDVAQDKVIMEHSQVYTMSCYARLITGTGKIRLVYGKGSYFRQKYALTTEWKRYSFTFTYDKTKFSNKLTTNIFFGIEGKTLTGEICAFKLEKGTKVSDYTTAPEDTQTQIDNVVSRVSTAEQKITPNAIVSTVTNSATYKNNLNSKVNISDYNSKIEQLSNSITSKVTKADVESMISANLGKYKGDTNRLNVALFDQSTLNKGEYYKIYKQHGSSDSNSIVEVTSEYNIDDISSLKIQPSGIYSSNKVGINFEAIDISKLGEIYPSFSVYVMPRTLENSRIEIGIKAYNSNGDEVKDIGLNSVYIVDNSKFKNNDWSRIYFATDEIMSDYNIVKIVPYVYALTESSTFYVCKPQFELLSEEEINKGEYMHEWTLGIKDMWKLFTRVDTAEQKITPNAIISTVRSSTAYQNDLNNKIDRSTYESKITQLSNKIETCVTKDGIGTQIEQNWEHVRIAWNNCSKYIQLEEGELNIYDKTSNSLRFKLNDAGEHFLRDGYKVGKIGTNVWNKNNAHKGLSFDLEYQGKYMTFAEQENSTDNDYTAIFTYSRKNSIYTEEGLHFGKNCYMHNYTISDVELKNVSVDNTYAFTGNIPIVTKIEGDSHWTSSITVKYGIIISAPKE